jgi:hypothetical protein
VSWWGDITRSDDGYFGGGFGMGERVEGVGWWGDITRSGDGYFGGGFGCWEE